SRSTLFRLEALGVDAARQLIAKGLAAEGADADDDAVGHLAGHANGDGRHVLTSLEVAVAIARARWEHAGRAGTGHDAAAEGDEGALERPRVRLADAEAALGTKALRYGRDEHYDVISAF